MTAHPSVIVVGTTPQFVQSHEPVCKITASPIFEQKLGKWHAGEVDRQQLWQRNQDRPATASRQQSTETVRLEDLDIYIVSHSLAHSAILYMHVLQTGRLLL